MGKLTWYVNRLKAMNVKEVLWRLEQKKLQQKEKKKFDRGPTEIGCKIFSPSFLNFSFDANTIGLYFNNRNYHIQTEIHLLGNFQYHSYKKKWNSGFQTDNEWPSTFSYQLSYKQRDDIGDARTNWELNRHFQFTLLAKAYYVTGKEEYWNELQDLWTDWNRKNLFLHGISWTSVMEIAIRDISWMFTLAFLKNTPKSQTSLVREIQNGVINMTEYISQHYSRFSSANNHLLVEATAIGIAGFCFHYEDWKDLAIRILSEELEKQNYSDGVNKELSLHYQTFVMEAYGILAHCMQANGMDIPVAWKEMLDKMCQYVSHCLWNEKTVCEFGDDDEGKILDLSGGKTSHYAYVLQLCSLVLNERYSSFNSINETINWLFPDEQIKSLCAKPVYDNSRSRCFKIGGNSVLRDSKNRILIGIDHAALGFGSIAAHGHADSLSFQLFVDGFPIFIDPGTYIYHCYLDKRNQFRKTINHNTLCVRDKDQSEMLGAFLWGRKAETTFVNWFSDDNMDWLIAFHNGYFPIETKREFVFDKAKNVLTIIDSLSEEEDWTLSFLIHGEVDVIRREKNVFELRRENVVCILSFTDKRVIAKIEEGEYSDAYGIIKQNQIIRVTGNLCSLTTNIQIYY